jgi:TonB family protein
MVPRKLCVAAGLLALSVVCVVPARAQTPARGESQLLSEVARYPRQVANYLDLARLYVDQGRFDEAERILSQAISAIRAQKMVTVQPPPGAVAGVFMRSEPPPLPETPLRVGGSIVEPKKIKDVKPAFPEIARSAGITGVVILEVVIDEQGLVREAKVLRSIPLLDQAALDAVRQWEYTPTLLNGQPVSLVMTVTVNFRGR